MKLTREEAIKRIKTIHGDKYGGVGDIDYINIRTKVKLICPKHGEFWITPKSLFQGCGCWQCAQEKRGYDCRLTQEDFIERATKVHDGKYTYEKVNYIHTHVPIEINCPIHGYFKQTPLKHLYRHQGCPKCQGFNKTTEDFINEYKSKFPTTQYSFEKTVYKNAAKDKVIVTCPFHGDFKMLPMDLLHNHGCPHCKSSKLEKTIREFLISNNINFDFQKRFEWLGLQSLDFYLPDHNLAIECQGEQHFKPVDFAGKGRDFAKMSLSLMQERDLKKKQLCEEHNIKVIYFSESKYLKHDKSLITDTNDIKTLFII